MNFTLADSSNVAGFYYEKSAFSGVKKIADKVREDVRKVCGFLPERIEDRNQLSDVAVFFGTIGQSDVIDELEKSGQINLVEIRGKREVYGFFLVSNVSNQVKQGLVIVGSDKRGTIYGLFHISDLLGVSPLVNWSHCYPQTKKSIVIMKKDEIVTKEPSVEYRGFFINDEWPAFGNWCMKRFGGMNATMYEHVFELLLRMRGNYLWPAMWASCFAKDGPGLANAELADEFGVVMGLSHHEPCLRHGEEYSHVRGADSIYGDAWNFRSNAEGITRFWEDGLKRNGHLENVITIGMRGERDSTIMGDEATLSDNIELLKDVIQTQHKLIQECVDEDLSKVPRLLALYKEVEAFFYGDEQSRGLLGWKELEEVILLLCDDNHGYLRTVPDQEMRKHPGGYGMYYHFDYHGDPISYEWTNSTYLPRVWEQMTMAYESGIRKLWIVNVGDLGLQEFPLSYFMQLAYDYDTWGVSAPNSTQAFTKLWMQKHFGTTFSLAQIDELCEIYSIYTRINHNRKPEHLGDNVYHPVHYDESFRVLKQINKVMEMCQQLLMVCNEETDGSFYELIYYNLMASMNLHKLWIYTGWNHYLSERGVLAANDCASIVCDCLQKDEDYKEKLHTVLGGAFYGFGLASHIGFKHWNDEESRNPVLHTVLPRKKPYAIVGIMNKEAYTSGEEWTKKKLVTDDFLDPRCSQFELYIALGSEMDLEYKIESDQEWIQLGEEEGTHSLLSSDKIKRISVRVAREQMPDSGLVVGNVSINLISTNAKVHVEIPVSLSANKKPYQVIRATEYAQIHEVNETKFVCLDKLGRDFDAMKLFPVLSDFSCKDVVKDDIPYLEYDVTVSEGGDYLGQFYLVPANPLYRHLKPCFCFTCNGEVYESAILSEHYEVGTSREWERGVVEHVRIHEEQVFMKEGQNKIRVYYKTPGLVLEKMVFAKKEEAFKKSFLGPIE